MIFLKQDNFMYYQRCDVCNNIPEGNPPPGRKEEIILKVATIAIAVTIAITIAIAIR